MTTSTVRKGACAHESEARNGTTGDRTPDAVLVWQQINAWVWVSECGRFKIERFIIGEHEGIHDDYTWPDRYRALQRTPEWYFEAAPSEGSLAAAKQACEGLT